MLLSFPGYNCGFQPIDRFDPIPDFDKFVDPIIPNFEVGNLVLREWQRECATTVYNILLNNHLYVDTSNCGAGKTILALFIAKSFNMPIIVISPTTVHLKWREECNHYGVTILETLTYHTLAGQKNKQLTHAYLTRQDVQVNSRRKIIYTPTEAYLKIVDSGVLVIFDESHSVKNHGQQYKAALALIQPILNSDSGLSRYALLSATPICKDKQILNLIKLYGIVTSKKAYSIQNGSVVFKGLQEIYTKAENIDAETTRKYMVSTGRRPNQMEIVRSVYNIYTQILKPQYACGMIRPVNENTDIKNGFYKITDLSGLNRNIDELIRLTRNNGTFALSKHNLPQINTTLMALEKVKIPDMARVSINKLQNSGCKIIIMVNFKQSIEELSLLLTEYKPLILTGSITSIPQRMKIIKQFNGDPNYRVLLANVKVGGVGIDLHDTVGDAPRVMFISPSYHMISILQAVGRVDRDGTMSKSEIRLFYANDTGVVERKIIDALIHKANNVSGMSPENNNAILPSNYGDYYE